MYCKYSGTAFSCIFFPFSGDVNLSLRAKEVILKGKRFRRGEMMRLINGFWVLGALSLSLSIVHVRGFACI